MDERVIGIAEDLYFHYTNNNVETSELIPYYTSEDVHLVNKFVIDQTLYKVGYTDQESGVEDKRLAILTDSLVFCPQLRSSIANFRDRQILKGASVYKLIEDHKIHPFLLFLNGRFVKWSDLTLYKDSRYCALVIDTNIDYTVDGNPIKDADISILQLPIDNITYTEKTQIDEDRTLIFGFSKDGYLDVTGPTRIYMDQKSIGYIQLLLPGGNIEEDDVQVPDEYQLYPSNFIIFKDDKLYPTPEMKISPYNTLTVDNGETLGLEYKMFYDKRSNIPYNNVSQIINHNYLKDQYLNTVPNPEWLSILHQKFDFDFDKDKSYDENILEFTKFMLKYNYRELINRIKSDNVYSINGYIGDLTSKATHRFLFPREYEHPGYMLFINGILSNSIVKENLTYGIVLDLSHYSDNSIYEFVVFNNQLPKGTTSTQINSNEPDIRYFSGYENFVGGYDLYCKKHPNAEFDLSPFIGIDHFMNPQYRIDREFYIVDEDGITFNEFYSSLDKEFVYKVPTNKFAYKRFVIEDKEDFNVHLPTEDFCFCDDQSKYMVFLNGYRVHTSLYRVIVPSLTTPFIDQAIYFSIVLKKGDVIEVFYTPMSIVDEVNIEDLNHSTEDGTGVDQLGYITGPVDYPVPISRDLQFFFVNGIKIPYDYLMDISYDITRIIVNMKTIENLCIIGFDYGLIEFFKSLNLQHSLLDQVYEAHDKMGINILTDTYTAVTNVKPTRSKEITDHALINEIVRYYYGRVNTGKPFRYDYDSSVYAEVDAAGNIVIDVMDGNKNVNLKLEK